MKKFLISFVLILTFLSSIFTVAYADNITGYTTASALNVRNSASLDGKVLGLLPYNSKVTVTDTLDAWYAIAYQDSTAYVSRDYVRCNVEELIDEVEAPEVSLGEQVVKTAKNYIGTPYVYGGTTPNGFDCSGFTKYIYSQYGVALNRTSYSQVSNGYSVSNDSLQSGDLVFFSSGSGISHVGIYVGNNSFIHSPRTGKNVEITSFQSYGSTPCKARRIF